MTTICIITVATPAATISVITVAMLTATVSVITVTIPIETGKNPSNRKLIELAMFPEGDRYI